jgi:hypothetical protein
MEALNGALANAQAPKSKGAAFGHALLSLIYVLLRTPDVMPVCRAGCCRKDSRAHYALAPGNKPR